MYRVAAYVGVLLAVALFIGFRSARAEVNSASFALGRDLLPLADLLGERAQVNLNGEHLWASSSLVPSSMKEVLDRFEAQCRASNAGQNEGIFRSEEASEGAVLCFVDGKSTQSLAETQDLGRMRYAYVRRGRDLSHVLTIWSDDHLRLDKLAGIDTLEPGSDHPDLPRPVRARRTVSASIEGTPYGMHGYVSEAPPADVLAAYTEAMESRGFHVSSVTDESVRGYMKGGSLVTIGVEARPDGTLIGIAEMGADPHVTPFGTDSASIQSPGETH